MGGVPGTGDQPHAAAPQARNAELLEVGEPALADAGEQSRSYRAVSPQDVSGELIQRQS
jgi:hypothetical protein